MICLAANVTGSGRDESAPHRRQRRSRGGPARRGVAALVHFWPRAPRGVPPQLVPAAWAEYRKSPGHVVHVDEGTIACAACHDFERDGSVDPGPAFAGTATRRRSPSRIAGALEATPPVASRVMRSRPIGPSRLASVATRSQKDMQRPSRNTRASSAPSAIACTNRPRLSPPTARAATTREPPPTARTRARLVVATAIEGTLLRPPPSRSAPRVTRSRPVHIRQATTRASVATSRTRSKPGASARASGATARRRRSRRRWGPRTRSARAATRLTRQWPRRPPAPAATRTFTSTMAKAEPASPATWPTATTRASWRPRAAAATETSRTSIPERTRVALPAKAVTSPTRSCSRSPRRCAKAATPERRHWSRPTPVTRTA